MARGSGKTHRRPALGLALVAGAVLLMHGCASMASRSAPREDGGVFPPVPSLEPVRWAPGSGEAPGSHDAMGDSLVVATWNVHGGGGDLPAFLADLEAGSFTGGRPPRTYAVLLQEAHRQEGRQGDRPALRPAKGERIPPVHAFPPSGERRDVVAVALELGLHLAYAPALPNGRAAPEAPWEDRGVAILSTRPLDSLHVLELPLERQRRVAISGVIRGDGADGTPWALRLVSAHLENRVVGSRFLDSFGAARERQARFLAERLGTAPTVLGADLNTWAPSFLEPALPLLEDRFPSTPPVEGATFRAAGIARRLDHLLFRLPDGGSARAQVVGDRYGSDHHPVIGVVGLPSGG